MDTIFVHGWAWYVWSGYVLFHSGNIRMLSSWNSWTSSKIWKRPQVFFNQNKKREQKCINTITAAIDLLQKLYHNRINALCNVTAICLSIKFYEISRFLKFSQPKNFYSKTNLLYFMGHLLRIINIFNMSAFYVIF